MRSLVLIALCAVAVSASTYNPVSFCQRYTAAVFPNGGASPATNATNQMTLIQNVVYATALGGQNVPAGYIKLGNGPGVFNSEITYFNGTYKGPLTYVPTGPNAANVAALVGKLTNFFANALDCREYIASITPTYVPSTAAFLQSVHAALPITAAIFTDFISTNMVAALTAAGVASVDLTYAGNLLAQFGLGGGGAICNQAGCPAATGFAQFTSGSNPLAWMSQDATPVSTVTVTAGSNIHWNIGSIHCVIQTDASGNAMTGTGIMNSGAIGAVSSYNWAVPATPTDTTYYFKCCNPAHTQMTGTVVVGRGSGSGASAVTTSMWVVLTAIVAALALRF